MPSEDSKVLAVLCSDIHLTHLTPPARVKEPNWYKAMRRPIREISDLAEKHQVPVIVAGDIFHKWNSPPELINFALGSINRDRKRPWLTIPGQHDLPYHSEDHLHASAYRSIEDGGCTQTIGEEEMIRVGKNEYVRLTPCFWGQEIPPAPKRHGPFYAIEVLVAHRYVWTKSDNAYPGASPALRVAAIEKQLQGYDVALFGDNHKGFDCMAGACHVWNNGCVLRLKSDEADYRPRVGLLLSSGRVKEHRLNTSEDRWLDLTEAVKLIEKDGFIKSDFIEMLKDARVRPIDFESTIKHYLETYAVSPAAKQIVLESLNDARLRKIEGGR